MMNKSLIIILLCLTCLISGVRAVEAQQPEETVEEVEPIVVAPSGQLNVSFRQLGYDNNTLTQVRPSYSYRMFLPGNFAISPSGNYFDLITSYPTNIPLDSPVSLQVEINGRPISTIPLTITNTISNVTRVDLPQDLLRIGQNGIKVSLNTNSTCEDPGLNIDVLIDQTSTLSFGYQQRPYMADLALYPHPFVERGLLDLPVTLVLPDQPTAAELAAATTVAAGLGQAAGGNISLATVVASELSAEVRANSHLIIVGTPERSNLLADLQLPLPIDRTLLKQPGQGMLQEVVSPWNEFRLVLVVTGLDDEGILKASQALNRQVHFLSLRGPAAVVIDILPLSESSASGVSSVTLAALGYEDEVVYGALPQDYVFNFDLPTGWQFDDLPSFVLKFSHADILDPYQSIIDVKLNNLPVGSTLLDKTNAREGELVISLPEHRLKPGQNRLQVGVKMSIPNNTTDPCQSIGDERAWTVISNQSEIFLPYNSISLPAELSLLPYPFSQNIGFNQTLFILPDETTPSTFNDLTQLAILFGSASRTENIVSHVAYASEIDETLRKNYHLVLLGRPSQNSLLREINASLPHPFAADSDMLESLVLDSVAYLPDPNRDAGLLQVLNSPWNENYGLLTVTGTSDEGVKLALQTLLERSARLKGNLAVIEPPLDPLATEPNQVTVYSIDTRSRPAVSDEQSSVQSGLSESEATSLAGRWWK